MNGLTLEGTPELVSRDQVLRRERGQGFLFYFFPPVQLTTRRSGSPTRLIHTLLKVMTTDNIQSLLDMC